MAKKKKVRLPSYCLHKPTNMGYCRVKGKPFYFGDYDADASREKYDKFIAEFLANGRRVPTEGGGSVPTDISISSLCLMFLKHAEVYGYSEGELGNFKSAIKRLRHLYGSTKARLFGPIYLKAFRESLIEERDEDRKPLARTYINSTVRRIVQIFRWGVGEELLTPETLQALQAVPGLRKGRSEARETEAVKPVPEADYKATLSHLPPVIKDMVQVQKLTGARPGEVIQMRPIDVDTSTDVWQYRPMRHKNDYRGQSRTIFIGPRAQAILAPYLENRSPKAFCFQPKESEQIRSKMRREERQSKVTPSQEKRSRDAKRHNRALPPGTKYDTNSYRRAVARACVKAGVTEWTPNQLRHNCATLVRKRFGLESSQVVLGHSKADTTQIYAERDLQKAMQVAKEIG